MDVKDNAMVVACADKMIYVFDLAKPDQVAKATHRSITQKLSRPPPPPSLARLLSLSLLVRDATKPSL